MLLHRKRSIAIGAIQVREINKAGYTATPVAFGWAGAIIEVSGTFGQEQ